MWPVLECHPQDLKREQKYVYDFTHWKKNGLKTIKLYRAVQVLAPAVALGDQKAKTYLKYCWKPGLFHKMWTCFIYGKLK